MTYHRAETAIIRCISVGGPNNIYQWQANDTDIPGESMENLTLTNVNVSTGGKYTCVVINAAGNDSDSTFIFIAPYFVSQPINITTTNGSSVNLLCIAEAFPSPSYQWAHGGLEPIREELLSSVSNLIFDPVLFGDEGDYYCTVTSRKEIEQSEDATLTSENCVSLGWYCCYQICCVGTAAIRSVGLVLLLSDLLGWYCCYQICWVGTAAISLLVSSPCTSLATLGFLMKFALFFSHKTTVRVKLKFDVQVHMPFLILCTKFET